MRVTRKMKASMMSRTRRTSLRLRRYRHRPVSSCPGQCPITLLARNTPVIVSPSHRHMLGNRGPIHQNFWPTYIPSNLRSLPIFVYGQIKNGRWCLEVGRYCDRKGCLEVGQDCGRKVRGCLEVGLTFEPRHENKSCSACPKDQYKQFEFLNCLIFPGSQLLSDVPTFLAGNQLYELRG